MYLVFKFLHILGTVLLLGNVTVTAVWKVFADRSGCLATIAFAQRLVTVTDLSLTSSGIALMMIGGYGMALGSFDLGPSGMPWLFWSQVLFVASGLIWVCILIPLQVAQSRMAANFGTQQALPDHYRRLGRHWIFWGSVATLLLVAAMFRMVSKW